VGRGYQSTGGESKHRTSIDDLCKPTKGRICSRCDVYLHFRAVECPFPQVGVPSAQFRRDLIDFDEVVGGLSLVRRSMSPNLNSHVGFQPFSM
jgi:hypothetical protein